MAGLTDGEGLIIAAEATAERGIAILATAAGPIWVYLKWTQNYTEL